MSKFKFTAGVPACPVACKYCFITEHETRREVWNAKSALGVNKACTFVNVTPFIDIDKKEQELFYSMDWSLLSGDFVGFTAITDPFYPLIDRYLWHWLDNASAVSKLTTCVTKWSISRKVMQRLSLYPNFYLVVGITGNSMLEKVSMKKHIETLSLAKEYGVKCLPISHPYIAGVSDLWFLSDIKALGYNDFDVKGLRYCDVNMGSWMPQQSKKYYVGTTDEVLPEDGWREKVADAGLNLLSPRNWYLQESKANSYSPILSLEQATIDAEKILRLANVVTSSNVDAVRTAIINRKM